MRPSALIPVHGERVRRTPLAYREGLPRLRSDDNEIGVFETAGDGLVALLERDQTAVTDPNFAVNTPNCGMRG